VNGIKPNIMYFKNDLGEKLLMLDRLEHCKHDVLKEVMRKKEEKL
jgi:hypothetical protein